MKVLKTGVRAFAHAAALDKDGRLSNTIYCLGKEVYILNQDHSVIIRFQFPKEEFQEPVSFRAEDYDSNELYEEEGKIIFVKSNSSFRREKSCRTPGRSPEDVKRIWKRLRYPRGPKVQLSSDVLELLDSSLSHVEISISGGKLLILQRDIYSGSVITITKANESKGFQKAFSEDDLKNGEYGPVGLRTGDLSAMFSFCTSITLTFPDNPADGYFYLKGPRSSALPSDMEAFVAFCVYDEMGDIQYILKEE